MVILNQKQDEIVNFDNIMNINITGSSKEGFTISAGFIVGRDDNYRELGIYKTKIRAKEILQQIAAAYSDFIYYAAENGRKKTAIGIKIFQHYKSIELYEMPKE